jgi:hypothetical protein
MTKVFRNCRYEVYTHTPDKRLWSRHQSLKSAQQSYREAVNNQRGDHKAGTLVELVDSTDEDAQIIEREVVRW